MQTQILIGIGVLIIAIRLIWMFIIRRKNDKVQLDMPDSSELLSATTNSDIQRVRSILKRKEIDINIQDENGATPLYIACQEGN